MFEDSSGFVGNVGSIAFQGSVGGTGTFVGGTAYFETRENLGFRIPHHFSAVRSFFFTESTSSLIVSLLPISIPLIGARRIVLI